MDAALGVGSRCSINDMHITRPIKIEGEGREKDSQKRDFVVTGLWWWGAETPGRVKGREGLF